MHTIQQQYEVVCTCAWVWAWGCNSFSICSCYSLKSYTKWRESDRKMFTSWRSWFDISLSTLLTLPAFRDFVTEYEAMYVLSKDPEIRTAVYFNQYFFFSSQGFSWSAHLTAFDANSINKCWHLGWLLSFYKQGLLRQQQIPSFFLFQLLLFLSCLQLLFYL